MEEQPSIFRQKALEKLSSPDQLDRLMQVTNPRGWLALIALGLLIAAGIAWSIFGTLPTTLQGQGIITRPGGISAIQATVNGQVRAIQVAPREIVQRDQVVAQLAESQSNQLTDVTSFQDGVVGEVLHDVGAVVNRGDTLVTLEARDAQYEFVMYVPLANGKAIQPGMRVQVSPSTTNPDEDGFMLGVVSRVGEYAATSSEMKRYLGSSSLLPLFSNITAPLEIHVTLQTDSATPSGYKWSSGQGPNIKLSGGTLAAGTVILSEQHPIELVIPR